MAVPAHLTVAIEGLPFDALLADWRWLVSAEFKPVLMTAFGDLFLRDFSGQIHFLDVMSGDFNPVAASQEQFDLLCEDREQRKSWFMGFLLTELRQTSGPLAASQCYSCKVPLSLGGQLEPDNFERMDLQVHFSVLGQLHHHTKRLPPGTEIGSFQIEPPAETKKEKAWWQKLLGD